MIVDSEFSLNSATLLNLVQSGKSLMYNKNKRGPIIDPCGTPEVTGSHSDIDPEIDTPCLRPER